MLKIRYIQIIAQLITLLFSLAAHDGLAAQNRLMAVKAAKIQAARALVESVYGLQISANETVENMVAESYKGTICSKTEANIQGIKFEKVKYDRQDDIAQVVASINSNQLKKIKGLKADLGSVVFRRVGYGTSSPARTGKLKALRAAELDAYKQLAQQVVGYMLKTRAKIENLVLKDQVIQTKVKATLYLAQVTDYGWEAEDLAYVNMQLDLTQASKMFNKQFDTEKTIKVQGMGTYARKK